MNLLEATKLCRIIASLIPSQKFDDETPAMWSVPLADMPLADAQAAVRRLVKVQRYIGVADLYSEVSAIRQQRLSDDKTDTIVPNVDPDDAEAYRAELAAIRVAIGSGAFDPDQYAAGGMTLSGAVPMRALGDLDTRRITPALTLKEVR